MQHLLPIIALSLFAHTLAAQTDLLMPKNVLGTPLQTCCTDPMTGYYRNGNCETGPTDTGRHTVCAVMTESFLTFTKSQGNDLSTPFPQFRFPGLKVGDKWCLCALRWKEAHEAGFAPPILLEATNEATLRYVDKEILLEYAVKKQ